MIRFTIEKKAGKVVLSFWEEAPIEGNRIKPFLFKQNMVCLDMDEAKRRFQIFASYPGNNLDIQSLTH